MVGGGEKAAAGDGDGECPTFTHARRIFTSARRARQRTRRRSKWASVVERSRARRRPRRSTPGTRLDRRGGVNEAQARYAAETPAGSADGARRDRVSSPRTRPRAFSSFEFYFTSAVEPHADQPRPIIPSPSRDRTATAAKARADTVLWVAAAEARGRSRRSSRACDGAAAAITPEATSGDAPPPSSAVPAATPAACAGTRARPPRPPVSLLGPARAPDWIPSVTPRDRDPASSPAPPPDPRSDQPRPSPAADAPGTSQRRRRPRGASSGHHLHRRFPTPRRAPQRRPHGRSTRR